MDFKENIKLNFGNIESNRNFYNKPTRSFFNISIIYKNENNEEIIRYYGFISNPSTQIIIIFFSLF